MIACLALGLLLAGPTADDPPAGKRVDLDGATLFIPDGYRPTDGKVDLILHLHGAPSVVEPALIASGRKAALIEFNRKGLSSVYTAPFSDRKLLPRLIDSALAALKTEGAAEGPKLGRLTVSSFSAGFGGVREMLKDAEAFSRINALVLADSLYCGYGGNPADHRVDPNLMAGFSRFAGEAAAGRKALVVSHSAQVPEGYASTTETADDLMRSVGGEARATRREWSPGWVETRRFGKGRFLIVGFAGREADDHMRHLRGIASLWKAIPE